MALIPSYKVTPANTAPTFGNASSGDTAKVNKRAVLVVRNDREEPITVTIAAQMTAENGTDLNDTAVEVADGSVGVITLGLDMYRNTDGEAEVSYSHTTNVSRAVLEV